MKKTGLELNSGLESGKYNKTIIILLICLGLILLIFVLIMVYINYLRYHQHVIQDFVEEELLDTSHHCMKKKDIKSSLIPSSNLGNEYSINFWLYINDYNDNYHIEKNVISKGFTPGFNPHIILDKKRNDLLIRITLQNGKSNSKYDSLPPNSSEDKDDCRIKNIPLQRWVCIHISLHNTTLDVYLDGKLFKTCLLNGFPEPNDGNMILGGNKNGFNGYVSRITWANRNLSPKQIYDKYLKGPKIIEDPLDKLKLSFGLD
mgnify:CR=1 FL=1|tara:strand:- start:86 stop:865 length:780 start_codon:yes stop_codon:yes gene_type:complete